MKGDDVGLVPRQFAQHAVAKRNVTMRGSMEAVSADTVTPIQVIGEGVQESLLGHRMMKRSIKYGHLRNILAEEFSRSHDALDVVRIVKWRKVYAVFNILKYLGVDKGRLR